MGGGVRNRHKNIETAGICDGDIKDATAQRITSGVSILLILRGYENLSVHLNVSV